MKELHPVFDLLWDIKTEEDLIAAYIQKLNDLKIMKKHMVMHNIKLKPNEEIAYELKT